MSKKQVLSVCVVFYWFSMYTYTPILSNFAKGLGATEFLIGLIGGIYGFSQMITRIPLGVLSDRLNRKKLLLLVGTGTCCVSGLGMFFFPNAYSILFFRMMAGLAASFWVIMTVLYASYFEKEEAAKATGHLTALNSLGMMAAQLTGGAVASAFGGRYTFLMGGVAGLISFLLCLGVTENRNVSKKPISVEDIKEVARDRQLMLASLLGILFQFVWFATVQNFSMISAKAVGASDFFLGLLSTLASVPGLFLSPITGSVLLPRMGMRRTLALGFVLIGLATAATPWLPNVAFFCVAMLFAGCARGILFPVMMGMSILDIDPAHRSTAMGFYQALYGVGMFVGPVVFGGIAGVTGMTPAYLLTACICVLAIALAMRRPIAR